MDLNPTAEQDQLIDAFSSLYTKESSTERVRAAEPLGFDEELWDHLKEIGALEMAVDESAGGWGATMLDLSLVAEQHGRALGAAPLFESQVALRLLARLGEPAKELLRASLAGEALTTVALHGPTNGSLKMVPAGAIADRVIFLDGDKICVGGTSQRVIIENLGSMPVADVSLGGDVEVISTGAEARDAFEMLFDEWFLLLANALVGIGERSIEIGVDYVKERKAFGVPIGSFQAISHGLADAATAMDGSKLLSREAAWSADVMPERTRELAALAFGFSTESAREASYRALHYHGGYGFMLEYDIQLFFRRAKAWPALYGEPSKSFARAESERLKKIESGV